MDTSKMFKYGGKHFIPAGKFDDAMKTMSFTEIVSYLFNDPELGFCTKDFVYACKVPYDYKEFYEAAGCDDDLFRCVENGKLYVPRINDLAWFMEPPSKTNTEMMRLRLLIPCKYRHENGNCTLYGGFCTSVLEDVCTEVPDPEKVFVTVSVKKEISLDRGMFVSPKELEELASGKSKIFENLCSDLDNGLNTYNAGYDYAVTDANDKKYSIGILIKGGK